MKRITTNFTKEHYCIACGATLLLVLVGIYMYLISASVVHVVMQKEMQRNFAELHSEIAALETEYIEEQHAVSADVASLAGFVPAENKIFIERDSSVAVISRAQ